ncbi:EamA family transporter [Nocardia sp. CA-120079]|uniref:EamA family transporter n=1 Tax=Nocardia sp. CA-120079 TaxID=3239974 RepID=UPI003D9657B9
MKVQPRAARAVPAPILILAAMVSIQLGAGLAKYLFEIIGAGTAASVRLAFAGAIALLLWRPSLPVDRAALPGIIGLGVAVAGMNLCFYAAIERIPLGVAVTLDFLGPLTVAVIASRRPRDLVWTVVAGSRPRRDCFCSAKISRSFSARVSASSSSPRRGFRQWFDESS